MKFFKTFAKIDISQKLWRPGRKHLSFPKLSQIFKTIQTLFQITTTPPLLTGARLLTNILLLFLFFLHLRCKLFLVLCTKVMQTGQCQCIPSLFSKVSVWVAFTFWGFFFSFSFLFFFLLCFWKLVLIWHEEQPDLWDSNSTETGLSKLKRLTQCWVQYMWDQKHTNKQKHLYLLHKLYIL